MTDTLTNPANIAQKAFDLGRQAGAEGKDATACPYIGRILIDVWWHGYAAGLQDKQEGEE